MARIFVLTALLVGGCAATTAEGNVRPRYDAADEERAERKPTRYDAAGHARHGTCDSSSDCEDGLVCWAANVNVQGICVSADRVYQAHLDEVEHRRAVGAAMQGFSDGMNSRPRQTECTTRPDYAGGYRTVCQ